MNTGDLAKDFELPNQGSNKIKLFDRVRALQGAPLFLVFYKFNCPTCQFAFPHYGRIAKSLGSQYFLGVAQDTPQEAIDFRKKWGVEFDIACDMKPYPVSVQYKLEFVPTAFVIETDFKISSIAEGFDKLHTTEFTQRISMGFQAFDPKVQVPLLKPG